LRGLIDSEIEDLEEAGNVIRTFAWVLVWESTMQVRAPQFGNPASMFKISRGMLIRAKLFWR